MKQILLIIIFIGFLGILIGANIYMPRRFTGFFGFDSAKWLYVGFAVTTILMIIGVMGFSNSLSSTGHLLYSAAALTMGFMLYLLISTLLVDLLGLFIQLKPVLSGMIALGLALLVTTFGIWNAFNLHVSEIGVKVNGLKNEVRVMHLSDIHLGHFRGKAFLQEIVDETNKADPDIVFITGDLFDGRINLRKETLEPLNQLKVPVYFVEGNHDIYTGVKTVKEYLRKINVRVLEDELVQWEELQIIGLNHMKADDEAFDMHSSADVSTIKDVLLSVDIDKDKSSVLLHHSPDGIRYANAKGIDLYLTGHTHAGQMFPINLLNELLFSYNKGLQSYEGTQIYVSQGAGTFGPPVRLGTRSEITLITLKPGKK